MFHFHFFLYHLSLMLQQLLNNHTAGGDGVVELNPDGTSRPGGGGAGPAGGLGADSNNPNASQNDPVYASNAGASGREAGMGGGAGGDGNSRQDDSAGDAREPGQRRSIISSIR